MRPWVDPGNNLVFADVHGAIGYRTRGRVPVRAGANAWLPVPGWDGAHEWQGHDPLRGDARAPRSRPVAAIVTANSRIIGADYPHYLGLDYAPDFRTRRVERRAGLAGAARPPTWRPSTPTASRIPAPRAGRAPAGGSPSSTARRRLRAPPLVGLRAWDGRMDGTSAGRHRLRGASGARSVRDLLVPLLGPLAERGVRAGRRGGP